MFRGFIALFGLLVPMMPSAIAQEWPASNQVRITTAGPPGSPPDIIARRIGQSFARATGGTFIVENKPGANTFIGMQDCKRGKGDGYTLCVVVSDSMSILPHLTSKLPYDPDADFVPIAALAESNSVVVVSNSVGARNFKEVVAASKSKPGTLNWSSFGNGSVSHLSFEWLRTKSGWDVTHVPFQNPLLAVRAVLTDEAHLTYSNIGQFTQHFESGRIIPLLTTGTTRSRYLPDVPTFSELGYGPFSRKSWFGLFAPAGMPPDLVERINVLARAAINEPEFKETVLNPQTLNVGLGEGTETPAGFAAFLKKDREAGGELVRISKVSLD